MEHKPENGQAGVGVTHEMIEAGVAAYDAWEPSHIFDGQGGAAPYAKKELVEKIFRVMMAAARHPIEQENPKDSESVRTHAQPKNLSGRL